MGTQLLYGWGEALVLDPYTIPNTYSAVRLQEYGASAKEFRGGTNNT